jgi:hypothetical protein
VERRRRETFSNLHRLFGEAVSAYREQLRRRVESDATRHFKALTTEPVSGGAMYALANAFTDNHPFRVIGGGLAKAVGTEFGNFSRWIKDPRRA